MFNPLKSVLFQILNPLRRIFKRGSKSKSKRSSKSKSKRSSQPRSKRSPKSRSARSSKHKSQRSSKHKSERILKPRTERSSKPRIERSSKPRTEQSPKPWTERSLKSRTQRSSKSRTKRSPKPKGERSPKSRTERSLKPRTKRSSKSYSEQSLMPRPKRSSTSRPKGTSNHHSKRLHEAAARSSTLAMTGPFGTVSSSESEFWGSRAPLKIDCPVEKEKVVPPNTSFTLPPRSSNPTSNDISTDMTQRRGHSRSRSSYEERPRLFHRGALFTRPHLAHISQRNDQSSNELHKSTAQSSYGSMNSAAHSGDLLGRTIRLSPCLEAHLPPLHADRGLGESPSGLIHGPYLSEHRNTKDSAKASPSQLPSCAPNLEKRNDLVSNQTSVDGKTPDLYSFNSAYDAYAALKRSTIVSIEDDSYWHHAEQSGDSTPRNDTDATVRAIFNSAHPKNAQEVDDLTTQILDLTTSLPSQRNQDAFLESKIFSTPPPSTTDNLWATQKPPDSPHECPVCYDTLPRYDFPFQKITSSCTSHPFTAICVTCLASSIASQTKSNVWDDINCPVCHARLDHAGMRRWASNSDFETYDLFATRTALGEMESEGFRWCVKCSAGQLHLGGADQPLIICVSCGDRTCFSHPGPFHEGRTCGQVDKEEMEEKEFVKNAGKRKKDEAEGEKAVKSLAKPCVGCGYYTVKIDGCKHMTCSKCRAQWCWECGSKWVSGHLNERTCRH